MNVNTCQIGMFKCKRSSFAGMPLDRTKALLLTALLSCCLFARSQDQYRLKWILSGKDTPLPRKPSA